MNKMLDACAIVHIGSQSVSAIIAQVYADDDYRVLGLSTVKNAGLIKGKIQHRDKLITAVKQAIQNAEDTAGYRIHSVWVSVAIPEMKSCNSSGVVEIENGVVGIRHIVNALAQAKQKVLPDEYYPVCHSQHGICVDGNDDMADDVLGMHASQIEVFYHLMMLPVADIQNLQNIIQACDVKVDHILPVSLVCAEYALSPEKRQFGACLIDIGASTTSMCVYVDNKVVLTACFDEGAHLVTCDIATELDTTIEEAERIKRLHGTPNLQDINPGLMLSIALKQQGQKKDISLLELNEIIEARYQSILNRVFREIEVQGLQHYIKRGYILCGGGSQITGIIPFARRWLGLPVNKAAKRPFITAAIEQLEDPNHKKLALMNQKLEHYQYQAALGTLIYSQSEQFHRSEQSEPQRQHKTWLERRLITGYRKLEAYFTQFF